MATENKQPGFDIQAGENPNDPSRTGGTYDDPAMKIPLDKRTGPLSEFPTVPDPKPFKLNGG